MINHVLKKFVDNLNGVSLSANERAFLRKDFLSRTGLPNLIQCPSVPSPFVITSRDISESKCGMMIRVNLSVDDLKTFAMITISPM
jgi:hypothetical protein